MWFVNKIPAVAWFVSKIGGKPEVPGMSKIPLFWGCILGVVPEETQRK